MDKTLIVIFGPTGIGKTDISIELANHFKCEIIGGDSRQVYKYMNIGTAIPSVEQLNSVKHHLVQSIDITEPYTCGRYEKDVLSILETLFKTYNCAILVGGSGLYIDAVCNGIDNIPSSNNELRDEITDLYNKNGIDYILDMLRQKDIEYYNSVDRSNHKRIIRALEVCIQTGKTYTQLRLGNIKQRDFNIIKIELTMPRDELYDRINRRVDRMIDNGLESEARELYHLKHLNSLQTVGYRELFSYFDGEITFDDAVNLIKRNSRRYAKRQITWFSRHKDSLKIDVKEVQNIIKHIGNL